MIAQHCCFHTCALTYLANHSLPLPFSPVHSSPKRAFSSWSKSSLREEKRIKGRERQRERDKESERVLQTTGTNANTHQLTCDYNYVWSFLLIQENSSPKKMKILSSFTRFKHLWLFYFHGEQKYTITKACQAPARTKSPVKVVSMTHTLYSMASEAIK